MTFFSFISKIPWFFLISKVPGIATAVKNLAAEKEFKVSEVAPDFTALEKLVTEQAKIIAYLSDEINDLKNKTDKMTREIFFLLRISLFLIILSLISIITTTAIYIKIN